MTLRIEIVRDVERFIALKDPWQRLWDQAGSHIFQTHNWIAGWIAGTRGRKDIRLQIALVWDGNSLVGIMPCAVYRRSGLRVLQWAAQLFSDYCDCVINSVYGSSVVMRRLWDAMRQTGGFDLISLQQIRPDAHCRPFLDAAAQEGTQLQNSSRQERCMRIDNKWSSGDAFFRSLNKKGRNNHTRGKRILSEMHGEVTFEVIESGMPFSPVIEEILGLKEAWLRIVDPNSALLGRDRVVLRAVLESVWGSGLAKIFLLRCGGEIAAASINFIVADRMEAYFTAYEAAYERASPGTILIVDYSRWAFDHGLRHVDFLRGEEAFKSRMANAETLISSFNGARTLAGRIAMFGHHWLGHYRQRQKINVSETNEVLEPVN